MQWFLGIIVLTLSACSSPQSQDNSSTSNDSLQTSSPDVPIASEQVVRWNDQRSRGVDFLALGNEPSWSLEVDFDALMLFRSMNEPDSLITPVPEVAQAQDASVTRYRAVTEGGELMVSITRENCSDTMSGEGFPYSVRVRAKTGKMPDFTEFSGCGLYLGDYRLNDIWILETMNDEPLDNTKLAQDRPYLEFQLADQKAFGFAGCNRINTSIIFEKAAIEFGPIISTRMSCPVINFEQAFTQALSEKMFSYTLGTRQLTLTNHQDTLIFKKVD